MSPPINHFVSSLLVSDTLEVQSGTFIQSQWTSIEAINIVDLYLFEVLVSG